MNPRFSPPLPGSPPVLIHRPGDPPPYPATHPSERPGYLRRARAVLAAARDGLGRLGRPALHRVTDAATAWVRALATKLVRGGLGLGQWFVATVDGLIARHYAGTLALTGGDAPAPPVLDNLDARINRQAGFLKRFRHAIQTGVAKGAGLVARAALYGAAIWGLAQNTHRDAMAALQEYEIRILDDGAKHCGVCPGQAAMGWQPVGTLLPIGDTPCQNHCRCYFDYSDHPGPTPTVVVMPHPAAPAPKSAPQPAPTPAPIAKPTPPPKPAPAPVAKPSEPPKFGPSKARVRHLDIEDAEINQAIKATLGPKATKSDLASLAGATDDALVDVSILGKTEIQLAVRGKGYEAVRRIRRNLDGELVLSNEQFYVAADHQRQGIGTRVFGRQVETAARLGVKRINTHAVGAPGSADNGYATWPKFGYDGEIPDVPKQHLPASLAGSERLSDLMRTPEGRAWWTAHGQSVHLSFNLSDGSLSRAIWDGYLRSRTNLAP